MNRHMDRRMERAHETGAVPTRRLVDSAQDLAERAGAYVQARMQRVSDQAQGLAHDASGRVAELTGRPVESWARDAQRYVEAHPLRAVAIAVGLGYVLGKLLTRD